MLRLLVAYALTAAICTAFFVATDTPGFNVDSARGLGETFGAAAGFVIFSFIFGGITYWICRQTGADTYRGPLVVGVLASLILAVAAYQGARIESPNDPHSTPRATTVTYSPRGCEFRVTFPAQPEILPMSGGTYEQANVYTNRALLRAECISPTKVSSMEPRDLMRSYLKAFAMTQGLTDTEIKIENSTLGLMGKLAGRKKLARMSAKYDYRMVAGTTSTMSIATGYEANSPPPPESVAFLSSLMRVTPAPQQ